MPHLVYTIVLFLAAQGCVIWNARLTEQMITAVNEKSSNHDAIPYSLAKRSKFKLVEADYKRLYPTGRLSMLCSVSLTLGFACFLLAGIMFFKPGR